jgi:hypothetical protein
LAQSIFAGIFFGSLHDNTQRSHKCTS